MLGPATPGWTPAGLTLRIAAIRAGSPMSDEGLRAGDIIESIDGRPLRGMADWFVARAHFRIGRLIQIGVRRGGQVFQTLFVITRERRKGRVETSARTGRNTAAHLFGDFRCAAPAIT